MKVATLIIAVFALCWPGGNVRSQTLQPLQSEFETADDELAIFVRCAALARVSWRAVNPDFVETLDLGQGASFIAMSHDNVFDQKAQNLAFEAAGHDWNEIWTAGKKNGGLPNWTFALTMGVDALENHNANYYRRYYDAAKVGDADKLKLLRSDLMTCVTVGMK